MKIGFRTPSPKRSFKARTTGKVKRKVKKSVNPLYGKKGMGYIKNPEKAFKQKVYHKTTVGVNDVIKSKKAKSTKSNKSKKSNIGGYAILLLICISLCLAFPILWIPFVIIVVIIIIGMIYNAKNKKQSKKNDNGQ